jgi:hypothetical protein
LELKNILLENNILKLAVDNYKSGVNPPFDELLNLVGFDALCAISEQFGGCAIYIPTRKRLFRNCIKKQVLQEFNGGNYRTLAIKYGVCERTIRNMTNFRLHK